mmetsp:Transcript_24656/g.56482  ORF Transcript_24656/g.56482 Transcript_24656/m.56482 type:complete len:321 (-) Transcript_24656:212-1174(-)
MHAVYGSDMFNGWKHWSNHFYFYEVPSRWYACWQHYAAVKSGLLSTAPASLLVDEEYSETVAVYQAVLRANSSRPWVMAELGARWGTWASRSVAFLRRLRGEDAAHSLYVVESKEVACDGIQRVMKKNSINNYVLNCSKASPGLFFRWAATVPHIDLVDFDVQNAELALVPELHDVLRTKAYRLIIGTHSARTHSALKAFLAAAGWLLLGETKFPERVSHARCIMKYLRGNYNSSTKYRFNWPKILKAGCYTQTAMGPVAQSDGELVFDNPRFVVSGSVFSFADVALRASELRSMGTGKEPRAMTTNNDTIEHFLSQWKG